MAGQCIVIASLAAVVTPQRRWTWRGSGRCARVLRCMHVCCALRARAAQPLASPATCSARLLLLSRASATVCAVVSPRARAHAPLCSLMCCAQHVVCCTRTVRHQARHQCRRRREQVLHRQVRVVAGLLVLPCVRCWRMASEARVLARVPRSFRFAICVRAARRARRADLYHVPLASCAVPLTFRLARSVSVAAVWSAWWAVLSGGNAAALGSDYRAIDMQLSLTMSTRSVSGAHDLFAALLRLAVT